MNTSAIIRECPPRKARGYSHIDGRRSRPLRPLLVFKAGFLEGDGSPLVKVGFYRSWAEIRADLRLPEGSRSEILEQLRVRGLAVFSLTRREVLRR